MTTPIRTPVISVALSFAFFLTFALSSGAWAQSKCDAGKLKEYGKKIYCLAKLDSKAAKTGTAIDSAKETKCHDKFAEKCAKAEQKGDCTAAVKSCGDLTTEADLCRDAGVGLGTSTTTTVVDPTTTTTVVGGCVGGGTAAPGESCSGNAECCSGVCDPGLDAPGVVCSEFCIGGVCDACLEGCAPGTTEDTCFNECAVCFEGAAAICF